MHFLDFFSESPKFYIFQRETSKTNFGGVLFLIYIIIMILISLLYILDYALNEKYTYESYIFNNITDDENEYSKIIEDNQINPLINITINFTNNNLAVWDEYYWCPIEKERVDSEGNSIYNFQRRVNDIDIVIFYNCGEDENCTTLKEIVDSNYTYKFGEVYIRYPGYPINHFNDPPVDETKPSENSRDIWYRYQLEFEEYLYDWEVIKYKDQKSLFDILTDRKSEYIFGHIKNMKNNKTYFQIGDEFYERIARRIEDYEELGFYLAISNIQFYCDFDNYLFHKRKKVELLDVIANIGALFSTIKFIFSLFFSFYSKNFDN